MNIKGNSNIKVEKSRKTNEATERKGTSLKENIFIRDTNMLQRDVAVEQHQKRNGTHTEQLNIASRMHVAILRVRRSGDENRYHRKSLRKHNIGCRVQSGAREYLYIEMDRA